MPNIQSPCMNCTERWVTETSRCHNSCERYAGYRSKINAVSNKRQKEKEQDRIINEFMSEGWKRYRQYSSGAKRGQL